MLSIEAYRAGYPLSENEWMFAVEAFVCRLHVPLLFRSNFPIKG